MYDIIPCLTNGLLIGHTHDKTRRYRIGRRHVEHRGNARPKGFPTEIVAIGVENLLGRRGLAGNVCRRDLI